MTISKEAIEAACEAYANGDPNDAPTRSGMEAALEAALPFLSPIAGEGKVMALDEPEGPFHVSRTFDGENQWFSARDAASGVSIPGKSRDDARALVASLNRAIDLHLRLASSSSPGKDGGQEVEAVSHGRYTDLIKALSRLSGNRQSDGVSSLVSRDDREAIITGCHDLMIAARQSPAAQPARLTKALEWEYHERPMMTYVASDERGMMYHINQAFGSDSYYLATVRFDGAILYDGDDLPSAKQAAQTDHEDRILSALTYSEHTHRLVENLTKALKPFARIADMEERLQDGESTMVNISRCREARAALSASQSTTKDQET